MKKNIVFFYSNNGSNRFLAHKIADKLSCDIEEISPKIKVQLLLMMGMGMGLKKIKTQLKDYDRVILCGPIWMGKFIYPLKTFIKKYIGEIKELVFVTNCGSSDEMKDEKFGHGHVFNEINTLTGNKCKLCVALPITLVVPEDKINDGNYVMQTRLNEDNFKGEIKNRFESLILDLNTNT
jgi:flavodoxin